MQVSLHFADGEMELEQGFDAIENETKELSDFSFNRGGGGEIKLGEESTWSL